MKICCICKEPKSELDFNRNACRKDGLNNLCKDCSRSRSRKYYNENSSLHKKNVKRKNQEQRAQAHTNMLSYLKEHPCVDCGFTHPAALQFDHVRGEKSFNISRALASMNCWATILTEISKCEVRCANCHSIKTAQDFNWYCKEGF